MVSGSGRPLFKRVKIWSNLYRNIKGIWILSMYPSFMVGFNIAKETTISNTLSIQMPDNKILSLAEIEELFTGIASPKENAVEICSKYFDLPSYSEMEKAFGL